MLECIKHVSVSALLINRTDIYVSKDGFLWTDICRYIFT